MPEHEGMLCPVCRVGLVMSERQGVEIDYCPSCRGVWLDRGELDKIIERSEMQQPMQQQQSSPFTAPGQYHQDYEQRGYDQRPEQRQQRRSFFSQFFDD